MFWLKNIIFDSTIFCFIGLQGVLRFLAMWPRPVQVLLVFKVFLVFSLKNILCRHKYLFFLGVFGVLAEKYIF